MEAQDPATELDGNYPEQCHVGWGALPGDALALVVSCDVLTQAEVGVVRLVCQSWCRIVTMMLTHLAPSCRSPDQLTQLPVRFPLLTHLDLSKFDHRMFDHKVLFYESQQLLDLLVDQLSTLPSLFHLTFSAEWAREMGRKSWAAWLASTIPSRPGAYPSHTAHCPLPPASEPSVAQAATKSHTTKQSTEPCLLDAHSFTRLATESCTTELIASQPSATESLTMLPPLPTSHAAMPVASTSLAKGSPAMESCVTSTNLRSTAIESRLTITEWSSPTELGSTQASSSAGVGLDATGEGSRSDQDGEWSWFESNCGQPQRWDKAILWVPSRVSELRGLRSLSIVPSQEDLGGNAPALLHLPLLTLYNLRSLNLSGSALGLLPQEVPFLAGPHFTNLQLQGCRLDSLTPQVGALTRLVRLDVSDNKLKEVPPEVGQLNSLQELLARRNMLKNIPPAAFSSLSCLTHLDLSHNQLASVPLGLHRCRCLSHLTLSHNWLKGLLNNGTELCCLAGLTQLEVANVSDVNHPVMLPAELMLLSSLQVLHLGDNFIAPTALEQLGDLPSLTHLSLNQLKVDAPAPHWLRNVPSQVSSLTRLSQLVVSHNAVRSLPPFLSRLERLQSLDMSSNGLTDADLVTSLEVAGTVPDLRTLKLLGHPELQAPANTLQGTSASSSDRTGAYHLVMDIGLYLVEGHRATNTACLA